jgi:hypothetical protein
MFGTIYRMHPKPDQEGRIADHFRRWERERRPLVDGMVSGYLFRPKASAPDLIGVAVFDSEANFRKNADDPAQDHWYRSLREMLDGDPEWTDGDVLVAI